MLLGAFRILGHAWPFTSEAHFPQLLGAKGPAAREARGHRLQLRVGQAHSLHPEHGVGAHEEVFLGENLVNHSQMAFKWLLSHLNRCS